MTEPALCCRAVQIGHHDEIALAYQAATSGSPVYTDDHGVERGVPVDIVAVHEMWRALDGEHRRNPLVPEKEYDPPIRLYQCKHVLNGTCTIYSRRPEMCRRYSCLDAGQELFRQNCASFGVTCFPPRVEEECRSR